MIDLISFIRLGRTSLKALRQLFREKVVHCAFRQPFSAEKEHVVASHRAVMPMTVWLDAHDSSGEKYCLSSSHWEFLWNFR